MRTVALVAAVAVLASLGISAQEAQPGGQIPSPPPGRVYAFDVESVKPSAPEDRLRVLDFQRTGSFVARNQTLIRLVSMAYGIPFPVPLPDERIAGGPAWLTTARFAVEARSERPPDPASAERDIGFMLRTLLADRFGLRVRIEPRPQQVYALVKAPKPRRDVTLRRSDADCETRRNGIGGGPGRMELQCVTLDLVAFVLQEAVGRPVVNQTGLAGRFDGSLEWAPSPEETGAGGGATGPEAQAGASIFTAVEEQLGLRLRDARAPIETVVITDAEWPAAN
jgi:bla regulator protein blaR1